MMGQFPEFTFTPAISFFVNCQTQAEVDNLVALTSAFATPLAGRLYDKIGPRIIMVVGFSILCVNTWQLSQLQGTTPISYIFFLLALPGLAIGLTLQTSFVTALSSVPLNQLPRGSSLLNSTRFVVQAVSVAVLATILVGYLSPDVRAQQEQMQNSTAALSAPFGVCETPGVTAQENLPQGITASLAFLPAQESQATKTRVVAGLQRACTESMQGFDAAYRVTFYLRSALFSWQLYYRVDRLNGEGVVRHRRLPLEDISWK